MHECIANRKIAEKSQNRREKFSAIYFSPRGRPRFGASSPKCSRKAVRRRSRPRKPAARAACSRPAWVGNCPSAFASAIYFLTNFLAPFSLTGVSEVSCRCNPSPSWHSLGTLFDCSRKGQSRATSAPLTRRLLYCNCPPENKLSLEPMPEHSK
jgi:hypothetical protein